MVSVAQRTRWATDGRAVAGEEPLHHRADGVVAVQRRGRWRRGRRAVRRCAARRPAGPSRSDLPARRCRSAGPSRSPLRSSRPTAVTSCRRRQRTLPARRRSSPSTSRLSTAGSSSPSVATARGHRAEHLRPGQVEQPSHVLRGDVVPRRAQHVGADHVAGVDRLADDRVRCPARAHRQRPARQGCVLRLDGQQVAYGVGRVGVRRTDQPLGGKPPRQHVVEVHRAACHAEPRWTGAGERIDLCARRPSGALPGWTLGCPRRGDPLARRPRARRKAGHCGQVLAGVLSRLRWHGHDHAAQAARTRREPCLQPRRSGAARRHDGLRRVGRTPSTRPAP